MGRNGRFRHHAYLRLCKANCYKIEGLDADEVSILIRASTPESEHETLKLYRRKDGTVTTSPNSCSLSRVGAAITLTLLAGLYVGSYNDLGLAQSNFATFAVFGSYNLLSVKLKRAPKFSDVAVLFVILLLMQAFVRFITDINVFRIAFPALVLALVLAIATVRVRALRKQKMIALQRAGSDGVSRPAGQNIQPIAPKIDSNITPCDKVKRDD